MTPKEYAKSRKLTLKQFNQLAKTVLSQTPDNLDEEQIYKLDAAIAEAAEQVNQLAPASDAESDAEASKESNKATALATSGSNELKTGNNNGVIEILGEDLLRRHMGIFMAHHVRSLQRIAESHKAILGKFEQEVYNETANTFARMTRQMEANFTDINKLANPTTEEDDQLYKDYILLVEEFLLPPDAKP